jgi:hypothetical protein
MGLYLTPYDAIEQHQINHVDPFTGTSPWSTSCNQCFTVYGGRTKAAETTASQVLFAAVPSLAEISWASFFTENRTGAALYEKATCLVRIYEPWHNTGLIFLQAPTQLARGMCRSQIQAELEERAYEPGSEIQYLILRIYELMQCTSRCYFSK